MILGKYRLPFFGLLFLGVCFSAAHAESGPPNGSDDGIKSALIRAGEGPDGQREAQAILESFPRDQVIPALVAALNHDPAFQKSSVRVFAYRNLIQRGGVETDLGSSQLLLGLDESDATINRICLVALGKRAPEDKMTAEVQRLRDALTSDADARVKSSTIKSLGLLGKPAKTALGELTRILLEKQSNEDLRWVAALAILRIEGIEFGIEQFRNLDTPGKKAFLTAVTRFIGESDQALNYQIEGEYRENRAKARKLVLESLGASNPEVIRLAAAESLFNAFGIDFVKFDSPTNYEWDPEIRATLTKLVNDQSPKIREAAQGYFATNIHDAARNLLRKQARYEKRRSQASTAPALDPVR
jgi:hypothetical protein